jgi:metal-responsive CopG/Arc/MetJ family transcriptional regulator
MTPEQALAPTDAPCDTQLTIKLPSSYPRRVDRLAERMGLTRSEVARRAMRNGLDELELALRLGSNPLLAAISRLVLRTEKDPEVQADLAHVLDSIRDTRNEHTEPVLYGPPNPRGMVDVSPT